MNHDPTLPRRVALLLLGTASGLAALIYILSTAYNTWPR